MSRITPCKFVSFSAPRLMVYSGATRAWRKLRRPNDNAAHRGFPDVIDKQVKTAADAVAGVRDVAANRHTTPIHLAPLAGRA